MAARSKKERWKVISGIALITLLLLGLFVTMWHHFNQPKHPADLVEFWSERYLSPEGQLERDLKAVIIPEIDFDGKPLAECLDNILEELNQRRDSEGMVKYDFLIAEAKLDEKITLKLTNVPASEALRYVTALTQLKYSVKEKGIIQIVPLEFASEETVEGKFFCLPGFFSSHTGKGPHSVVKELTSAGIALQPGDTADYYPEKEALIVATTEEQMDMVDVFMTPICSLREPTLYERISYRIQEFFNPSPPLPPAAPIPSGLPTHPSAAPDPDPFGAP